MRLIKVLQYGMYTAENAGGMEAYMINQFRNIDRTKMVYDYVARRDDVKMAYEDEIKAAGSKVYYVCSRHFHPLKHYWQLLRLFVLLRGKYDALVVNSGSKNLSFVLLFGWLVGIKCRIYHSHNTGEPQHSGLAWKFMSFVDRFCMLFATDYAACSTIASEYMFGDGRATVIPNAIDFAKFRYNEERRNKARAEFGYKRELVVGLVGNYSEQKNHAFAVRVIKALHDRDPRWRLLIAGGCIVEGDDSVKKSIRDYVSAHHLENVVVELGHRDDVHDLMQAFDYLIMPSIYEGFGIVAIEAQAAGLPCIVSDRLPQTVNISGKVKFLRLEDGPSSWADVVQDSDVTSRSLDSYGFDGGMYDIRNASNIVGNMIMDRLRVREGEDS